MRPRFLADADLNRAIVNGAKRRAPAIDFQTAQAVPLDGIEDAAVLALAAHQQRILVTHDFGTMPRHFRDFTARHNSPGVLLISQRLPVGNAVEELLMIWEASDEREWVNQLTYLPL